MPVAFLVLIGYYHWDLSGMYACHVQFCSASDTVYIKVHILGVPLLHERYPDYRFIRRWIYQSINNHTNIISGTDLVISFQFS
jgi:hypothetical protein